MRFKYFNLLVFVFLLTLFVVHLGNVKTFAVDGDVDWEEGVIIVEGFGVPPEDMTQGQARLMAKRAAKVDAYRNAVAVIEGIQVDSETVFEDYMIESDEVRVQLDGFVRGGDFISTDYGPDDVCKVELEVPLAAQDGNDDLTSFIGDSVQPETREEAIDDIERYLSDDDREEQPQDLERASEYTGVIIDTRGLNIELALYPQVFASDGYPIYGPNSVGPDNSSNVSSLVGYSRDESRAREMERLGDNPVVIEAVSVIDREGIEPTDVIVNSEAAEMIRELKANNQLAERKAVVFLVD